MIYKVLPKKNNLFFLLNVIDHERIALGNEEGLFVVHVTKDGKKLGTDKNFLILDHLFLIQYLLISFFVIYYIISWTAPWDTRRCSMCFLVWVSFPVTKIQLFECSWRVFPIGNWLNTDFRPDCSGLYSVGRWKSPRKQVTWSLWTACCKLLSQWNTPLYVQ